jgi:hypothetical protein
MYVKRPAMIPSVILPVTGISRMVKKAGIVSAGFNRLIWLTDPKR